MTYYFGWQFSYILNDRSWNQSWPVLNTSSTPSWAEVCLLIMDMVLSFRFIYSKCSNGTFLLDDLCRLVFVIRIVTDISPTAKYLLKALSLINCGKVLLMFIRMGNHKLFILFISYLQSIFLQSHIKISTKYQHNFIFPNCLNIHI